MLSGKDVGARLLTRCLLLLYAVPGLLSSSLFEFKEEACDGSMMLIRCPSGTTVDVQNAIYGQAKSGSMLCPMMTGEEAGYQDTGCPTNPAFQGHEDALKLIFYQKVVNMCQGRQSCRVRVSWESFGIDPCPGLVKNLEIHYKCKPDNYFSAVTCEDDTMNLKCKSSTRIAIFSAEFGHKKDGTGECFQHREQANYDCVDSFSLETVMKVCHGKKHCLVLASTSRFNDPCPARVAKYLAVVYTCVPARILKRLYTQEDSSRGILGGQPSYIPDPSMVNNNNNKNKNAGVQINRTAGRRPDNSGGVYLGEYDYGFAVNTEAKQNGDEHTFQQGSSHLGATILADVVLSIQYLKEHRETIGIYFGFSLCVGVGALALVCAAKLVRRRHRAKAAAVTTPENKSLMKPPPTSVANGVVTSDLDLLSDALEPVQFTGSTFRGSASPPGRPRSYHSNTNSHYASHYSRYNHMQI